MQRHIFFGPCPLGPWGGAKRSNIIKYHEISITKSISKIFYPNFVCPLTNERYKTYQTGFSFGCLGHAPGVGLGRTVGGWVVKKKKFPKFNQIWCVSYLHQWHIQGHNFFGPHPLGPWGGASRSNIIKSQSQSQFQRFLNQTLCVFSQMKDIKHIRQDFHSIPWVMPQGWDLGLPWMLGVKKMFPPNSTRFGV